jgi:hypothetical protein
MFRKSCGKDHEAISKLLATGKLFETSHYSTRQTNFKMSSRIEIARDKAKEVA